jgi:hypothetical protein
MSNAAWQCFSFYFYLLSRNQNSVFPRAIISALLLCTETKYFAIIVSCPSLSKLLVVGMMRCEARLWGPQEDSQEIASHHLSS